MRKLEQFARTLAEQQNITIHPLPYGMQFVIGPFVHGSYATRALSLPITIQSRPYGEANTQLREIHVIPFGGAVSDELVLCIWLHEMGHIASLWQPLLIWGRWHFVQHSVPHQLCRLWQEQDAWRWARKQFAFTPEMDAYAQECVLTYRVFVDRLNYLAE